jgi:type III secretion system low calcium response chaperone LcrH/SycD
MEQLYPLPGNNEIADESSTDITMIGDIFRAVTNGVTLKEICGIPENVMQAIYAHAYDFYQRGRFDDARIFFEFLCAQDIYNADYAMGMAAVHHQKKDYLRALQMYTLSHVLNPENISAEFHSGQCALFLKDRQRAAACFTNVIESAAPAALKSQAQAYLSAIVIAMQGSQDKKETHA